ncbi:MAG: MFS transporter [Bacillota bacterium]|jgi:predicted MFS family arabinose efflux permease|nr:MFS transporter [Clostridia bacterium]
MENNDGERINALNNGNVFAAEPQKRGSKVNLFLFLCGAVFSFVTFYSSLTVLPLYVYKLGGTEFDTGLQTILFYLASILMRFYFGPLTDRKGRKIPLIIGAFVFATSSLFFLISDSIWKLTLARIYHAVGLATFFSSGGSLIVDLAPSNRVGIYIGMFRLTFVLALLTGPSLAMSVINNYNFNVWFVFSFLIGLLSLLMLALIKVPVNSVNPESGSLQKFRVVLKEKAAYQVYYGIALVSLTYGVLINFGVLFMDQNTGIPNPGLYFTYFSIVGIFGNLVSGYLSDRWKRPVVVWSAVMLLGIGTGVFLFLPHIPGIFFISSILAGLGYSGGMASLAAWLVEVTDKDHRGTVLALQESVIDLSIGLSSFFFGAISGYMGMGYTFAVIGLFAFVSALIKFLAFCSFGQAFHHK